LTAPPDLESEVELRESGVRWLIRITDMPTDRAQTAKHRFDVGVVDGDITLAKQGA
jgi:hypothetical protein